MNIETVLAGKKKRFIEKKHIIGLSVLVIIVVGYGLFGGAKNVVDRTEVKRLTVLQGTLPQLVKAYGKLKSKTARVLTASSNGIVEEIIHYPGEAIKGDSVILRLSNPELTLAVNEAMTELSSKEAELEEFELMTKLRELEIDGDIRRQKLDISNARILKQAKQQLVEKGIVPQYEFQVTEAEFNKHKMVMSFLKEKQTRLEQINQRRVAIRKKQIKQLQLKVDVQQERLDNSNLRSGMDGVVQEIAVEVGQSVITGDKLAVVGGEGDLNAEIMIQQREASLVNIGDEVSINTYGSQGTGKIIRIDPVVTDGKVVVEVKLTGELPSNAKPELTVEASINISTLENVTYIKKTKQFAPNSKVDLFVLDNGGETATKKQVHFGEAAGQYIVVQSGLNKNDKIIFVTNKEKSKVLRDINNIRITND